MPQFWSLAVLLLPGLLRELPRLQLRPLCQHMETASLRRGQLNLQLPLLRLRPRFYLYRKEKAVLYQAWSGPGTTLSLNRILIICHPVPSYETAVNMWKKLTTDKTLITCAYHTLQRNWPPGALALYLMRIQNQKGVPLEDIKLPH